MQVYIVWRDHHAPLEAFTTQRKAEVLVQELARQGFEAFFTCLTLNDATPREGTDSFNPPIGTH